MLWKREHSHIYEIHIEVMWGWGMEICHMFVDSVYTLLNNLSGAKGQSYRIQSPDGDPPLENRTLSFRTHAQDTYI